MASYFLRVKHISRGKGARVTRAAAYRAGERIRDERTSEVYNYSNRSDVTHKEIVLPSQLAERDDMGWARDRSTLWNAAEHAGLRRNSRLAREVLVLLPPELTPAQRVHLVRTFSRELADEYGGAVDCAIHEPRPGADQRNQHAHLLMTTREVTPEGLDHRTTLELGGRERHLRGLGPTKADYLLIRERWAQVTNDALHDAGIEARVDHRSFKDQGINREPTPTIPEKVFYAEQRSRGRSAAGDAIRARHRERLEAREKGSDALERVLHKQEQERRQRAIEDLKQKESQPKEVRWSALTREERNQKRRETYQANREIRARNPEREARRRAVNRERARTRWQAHGAAIKERRRQLRRVSVDEVNRKQREYRKLREQRKAASLDYLRSSPTAEESARNWMLHRGSHDPGPTAEESIRNWLALNETRKPEHPAQVPSHQHTPDRAFGSKVDADSDPEDDDRRKRDRSRGQDFGL